MRIFNAGLLLAIYLAAGLSVSVCASDTPPNIVFIFVDDQGYYDLDWYRLASPLAHLDKTDAACWMITGENDYASTRGDELRSKMNDLGIPNGLTIIKDAPHSFNVKQVWFDEAMQKAGEFFIKRLMSSG